MRRAILVLLLLLINLTVFGITIFYDNFDNRKNEWQQYGGKWQYSSDGFLLQRTADPRQINCIFYVDNPQVADATIETFVRVHPDLPEIITNSAQDQTLLKNVRYIMGAGIIFRMKDRDNFYMFRLAGEEGAVLGKMVNGKWTDLANPRSTDNLPGRVRFSGSNWYRLKVKVYDKRILCYINDSAVVSYEDNEFGLGHFGLCTFKARADFDYIRIYN